MDERDCSSEVAVAMQCRSEEPVTPFVQFAEFVDSRLLAPVVELTSRLSAVAARAKPV